MTGQSGEKIGLTTTTYSSIFPVTDKCCSSGDTPLHTFSSSYMLFFWRHTAAYFQFQLNAILLATHRCILSVPVNMPIFWRHTAAYFQFQLYAILLATHRCILSVPVNMPIFWRHTAAYFQFQLNIILLATHRCILSVPVKRQSSGMYVTQYGRNCVT